MDQLPRLGKRELICLLSFTCNYVVFVWRGFLFLWVLGMGCVILLWHSLSLSYNYFGCVIPRIALNVMGLRFSLVNAYSPQLITLNSRRTPFASYCRATVQMPTTTMKSRMVPNEWSNLQTSQCAETNC